MSYSNDYLAHYGIPGMRWGRRNARKEQIRSNMREYKLGVNRETKKFVDRNHDQVSKNIDSHNNFNAKTKAKLHANNDAVSSISKVRLDYKAANIKAKQDRKYLESDEYFNSVSAYGKQRAGELLLGSKGYKTMQMYKNLGDSNKKAAAKVVAANVIKGLMATAVVAATVYKINKQVQG